VGEQVRLHVAPPSFFLVVFDVFLWASVGYH
jgi:hypothetical protein